MKRKEEHKSRKAKKEEHTSGKAREGGKKSRNAMN